MDTSVHGWFPLSQNYLLTTRICGLGLRRTNYQHAIGAWGGPPGPRGSPWTRSSSAERRTRSQQADVSVGRGPGGPPWGPPYLAFWQNCASDQMSQLARRLGLFDATMIVMGGIIGSGIFINPYIVARHLRTPALILGAWALGGWVALSGGFIWAELAARRPLLGGQYAYLREAYHSSVAFI